MLPSRPGTKYLVPGSKKSLFFSKKPLFFQKRNPFVLPKRNPFAVLTYTKPGMSFSSSCLQAFKAAKDPRSKGLMKPHNAKKHHLGIYIYMGPGPQDSLGGEM